MKLMLKLKRFRSKLFPERSLIKVILRSFVYIFLLATAAVTMLVFLVWVGFFGRLPSKSELNDIQHPLASEVYSADSVLLGRYFIQERSFLKPGDIPATLKNTLVATEDVRFYKHNGVDTK